jgi:AraC-like DNA-binding protein
MLYREFTPVPALSRYIKCIWTLEGQAHDLTAKEKVLPDGCMELVCHYGDSFKCFRDEKQEKQPHSFLFGQLTRYIELSPSGSIGIIAVRFFPQGLQAFLKLPLREITDQWVSMQDVFGNGWKDIEDRLPEAGTAESRAQLLQSFLLQQMLRNNNYDHLAEEWVTRILGSGGLVSVDDLTKGQRISYRHMERRFTSAVGINPKMLARITRLQQFLKAVQRGQVNSLTALACDMGYYDQSHFVKDFKSFTGLTPRQYFSGAHLLAGQLASES